MEEMSHSRFLFTTADGESLEFYVRLCAEKDRIAALILHGGGIISGSHALNVIKIVSSNRAFTVNDVGKVLHMQYILDCVEQNKLLDMSGYTLRNSKPVNDVSSEDDWDSDIETEDSSSDFDDSCHSKGTRKKAIQSQIRCRNVPKFPTVESRKIIDYILKHADRLNGMTQLDFSRELFKNKVASGTVRALRTRLYRIYYDIALYKLTIEKEKLVKSALLNMKEKAFKEKKDSKENESNNVQAKSSEGQKVRLANTENKKIVKYVLRNADKLRGLGRDEFYKKFLKKNIVSSLRGPFDQRLHRIFNHFEVFKLTSEEEKIFKDVLLSLQRKKIVPKKDIGKKNESDNDATLDEESDDFSDESDDNDAEAKPTKRFIDRTARKKIIKYIVENAERLQGKYRFELYHELKKNKIVNCTHTTFSAYSNYIINRIESYNLTAQQENIVVAILSNMKQPAFTWEDDMKLINYVIKNKLHGRVRGKGDAIYREMAKKKLLKRSALSMRTRLINVILPNLDKYNLPDHDVELLRSIKLFKKAELFTWEEDMKLINYVIKNELHKRVKEHAIYREMAKEKLLMRSAFSMRTRLLNVILSNLDQYNLPDHDVELLRSIKPFKRADLFTWEEDMKLINYVIKNKLHKRVKGNAIYREMAREKLLERSVMGMRTRFLRGILPKLDKYNLPDHDVKLLRSLKPFKKAEVFTREEDMKLINYVIEHKLHSKIRKKVLYDQMAEAKLSKRSASSMMERFVDKILPNLDGYNLSDHELELFKRYDVKRSDPFTEEEEMKMINYVIKHKLHDKVREQATYKEMAEKNLLKRSRTVEVMQKRFVYVILPNLDKYNLSDHDVELLRCLPKDRNKVFTREEDMKMINYVIENKLYDRVREDVIYKEMLEKKLLERSSAYHVRRHFVSIILRKLDRYNLSDHDFALLQAQIHKITNFTREEDMKMINYVIKHKLHDKVRKYATYVEMEEEKVLERSATSMLVCFTRRISQNLDSYNLSDHDVELLTRSLHSKRVFKNFTREDDMKMINYVIENKLHHKVRGLAIYREMAEEKVLDRSAESLHAHFATIILAKLDSYNLPDHDIELLRRRNHRSHLKQAVHRKPKMTSESSDEESENEYSFSDFSDDSISLSVKSNCSYKSRPCKQFSERRKKSDDDVNNDISDVSSHVQSKFGAKTKGDRRQGEDFELLAHKDHQSHLKQAVPHKPKMKSESSDEDSENEYSFSDFSDDSFSLSKHEKSVKSDYCYKSRTYKQKAEKRKKSDEDVNNDISDLSSDDFVHTHKAKKPCRLSSTGEHMDSPPANNRSRKISVKCRNSAVRNKTKSPKQNRETVTTYNIHETSRKTSDSQTMTPKRTNGSYKISQYFSIAKESSQNELEALSNAEVKENDDKERSNAASQVKRKIQRTLKFADAKKHSQSLPDAVDDLMCSNKELSGLDFDVENNATDTLIDGLPSSKPENSGAVLQNTLPSPLSEIQDSTISQKDSSIWASDEITDDTCGRNEYQTENEDNLLNMLTDPAYETSEEFVSPTAESLSLFGNEMLSQSVNDEVGGNRVANPEGSFSAEQDHFTECISILKDIEADIVGMDPSHKRTNLQNNIIELHSQLYQQRFKGSIRNIVNKEKLSITDKAILWKYIAYTKSKKPEDFVCDFES